MSHNSLLLRFYFASLYCIFDFGSNSSLCSSSRRLQLACLDSSLAIAPLFKRFSSVVITSGTLSPIDLYPKLLDFEPRVSESFSMSTFRPCIRPLIVSRGSDQTQISTRYQDRDDPNVTRNYGQLMVDLCSSIPDGIVAFFTSYSYLETIVVAWEVRK